MYDQFDNYLNSIWENYNEADILLFVYFNR